VSYNSLSNPLLAGTLVMAAFGSANARPLTSMFESTDVTFSSASAADAWAYARLDFSNIEAAQSDEDSGGLWSLRVAAADKLGVDGGGGGLGLAPVSAISEPPTLALLELAPEKWTPRGLAS
jgi:hypothetical protein